MLFNSYEFIFIFLPITFYIYFYLNNKKLVELGKGFLVFSSLFFYSWWNIAYLPLILISMLFNYLIGNTLSRYDLKTKNTNKLRTISKKSLLIFGIVSNLAFLAYYKYADFFIENFNLVSGTNINLLHLLLPLAISFFTFQQIAYLVDSYKNETKEYDFLNYALFVTFFPQLIAGPIVHHKEVMPQFSNLRNKVMNYKNIVLGFFIFSLGLFKKVIIADTFAKGANIGFGSEMKLDFFEAWATSLSYTFQLYFDFSGYTDMAIGIALIFNIKLPINFNSPYKALNIQDFWRRWHITLSRFLRDYVYIPLGGSKQKTFRIYTNLMITFIIGGFWHGAGWTFLFWGFLHGLALSLHRFWQNQNLRMWEWLAWIITFNFVNIAWIFFRAKDWDNAINILRGMFGFNGIIMSADFADKFIFLTNYGIVFDKWLKNFNGNNDIYGWLLIGFFLIFMKNSNELKESFKPTKIWLYFIIILLVSTILSLGNVSEFLYFNF